MMPFRSMAGAAVLLLVLAGNHAHAAWNNAFQLCCFGCRDNTRSYYVAPPTVAYAPPSSCCSTSYVQRCYYQPVTTYKTVLEPVTSYRTSYYMEPVRSYRSSCYYDPCSGSSVQVTTPVTTYRMRSQCNAVTSYVQKCVPVTAYRPSYYLEAVTSCAPPPPCSPCGPGAVAETPPVASGNLIPRANVPTVDENPPTGSFNNNSFRQPLPSTAVPGEPAPRRPMEPASMRLDHVVSRTIDGTSVRGQVVANNSIFPVSSATLVFVSKDGTDKRKTITTDDAGRFQILLASGGWSIYMSRPDGMMEYHSSIAVRENEERNVRVVSR